MENERRKILIVDDVYQHLVGARERLKTKYDVSLANSAKSMYEILAQLKPELILLDINMPDCDGFETLSALKNDYRYADIPVVFLTSNFDKSSILKGIKLGAADFITKPFNDKKLIACIEYHLDPKARESMKPIILAVDDSLSILRAINYVLSSKYTVTTLPNPEVLKEVLTKVTPDLFILDCQMPEVHGFDLVPMIRGIPEHEETPIVFLTTDGSVDHVFVALDLGACDFIVKPINNDILRTRIALHLEDYMIRRRLRQK